MFIVPILMEARYKASNKWPIYLYLLDYFNESIFDKDFPLKGIVCFFRKFISYYLCSIKYKSKNDFFPLNTL